MAYNLQKLAAQVDTQLTANPRLLLTDIARSLGVERHTVEKAVKKVKGMSFHEYQKKKLVQEAVKLLMEKPNMSIKQIAASLGYGALDSLSRFIKSATGKTPTEIRGELDERWYRAK